MSPQSGISAQLSEVRTPGAALFAVPFSRQRERPERALRYELNVVAADVAGTVSGIGGWLFDRAMAGWRVSVDADECGGERALRILGLKGVALTALGSGEVDAVAVTAIGTDRCDSGDAGIDVPRNPGDDVLFFGPHPPSGLAGRAQRMHYRPSAAALAFKAHALAVVGFEPGSVGVVETMFGYGRSAGLLDADLVPVC
ncbi:hypothetical protein ABQF34_17905 [Mycolicibacterium boenickei]